MAINRIEDVVHQFNDGELDVDKFFGGYKNFFTFLEKRDLLHLVDPFSATDYADWQNEFLIWQHANDYETFKKNVALALGDVVVENGIPYLVDEDLGDLSELFCDNRNDIALSTIKQILNGEYDSDYYYDTTIDVYKDVIDELTPKNTQHLYDYIVKALEGIQISPETDVLETIAEEQGHPEYVDVNAQTVIKIVDDEETMNSLLGDELSDLKGELYSIHSSAYNSAYESEIYRGIINKLGDYFEMENLEWGTRPHRYKKDTPVQTFKIPIVDFDTIILDYLDANKGYGNSGTLEYLGSFVSIIRDGQDCLRYYAPDYPDYRLIDKNINEFFGDYIY